MLQVPNYTLKHPQNKSGQVLVAERSHGEEWRRKVRQKQLLAKISELVANARYCSLSEGLLTAIFSIAISNSKRPKNPFLMFQIPKEVVFKCNTYI
jgi:hypothetical protein